MTTQTTNDGVLERHSGPPGLDFANAGRGLAAAADTSVAVAWVQKYAVVYHVVDQIVDTPLFPVGFWPMPVGVKPWDFRTPWLKHPTESLEDYLQRRRIAAAGGTTAALWGEGYGWSPPQSWRLIYVANGKASLYAEGVNALLRAQGFGLERLERTDTLARLRLRRPGGPWVEYEFTMADAERAGYVPGKGPNVGNDQYGKPKKGGNEKYHTDPKTMLWARCLTTAARIEAPDVIAGMPVAELIDDDPIEPAHGVTVTAQAMAEDHNREPGAASEALRAALEQAPPTEEQPAEPAEQPAADDTAAAMFRTTSDATWRALQARFVELGVTGTGQGAKRWFVVRNILRRPLVSKREELTEAEAAQVLRTLRETTRAGMNALLERRTGPDLDDTERSDEPAAEPAAEPESAEDQPATDDGPPAVLERTDDPWAGQ